MLVKILAAPINPSDLARINEMTSDEARDSIPGIEGCGIVVKAGNGILPGLMLGKRVACSSKYGTSGTWAEYMVTKAGSCFPIGRQIPVEQAAMTLVNPMTALAFLDIARNGKHRAVVNTAAAGALGKMVSSLFRQNGIPLLNVVRNEEGFRKLRERGEPFIVDGSGQDFDREFKDWCDRMRATLVLDAVGGEFVNRVLPILPAGSTILMYGNLSHEPVKFMPPLLVRENKTLQGFFLGHWIEEKGMLWAIRHLSRVKRLLEKGMETPVQATFPLDEAQRAVEAYEADMGKGKVLLKCCM